MIDGIILSEGVVNQRRMRIHPIEEQEATGELALDYDRIIEKRGKVWNVYMAQAHLPNVMKAHLEFYMNLMFGPGGLPRRYRELLGCYVSYLNNCFYCMIHHGTALRKLDPHLGLEIYNHWKKGDMVQFNDKERHLLQAADELTNNPPQLREEVFHTLREDGWGDREISQIVQIIAYFNYVNRLMVALDVAVEEDYAEDEEVLHKLLEEV